MWVTKNMGRHFLDMVTMSDIAYTIAVIENSYKAWDAECKETEKGEEEDSVIAEGDQQPQKTAVKSKFTGQGEKKRECNKLGWSNEGIEFYKRVHECWCELSEEIEYNTWTMLQEAWATYKEKTNFCHSSRRKKNIHKETEMNFNEGGEDCAPLWGAEFCLLDRDEDFLDDQPASKRMRQECADDHSFGISSDDDSKDFQFEVHGGCSAWVSMGDFVPV